MDLKNKFILLQINDALFPIGGYSHSFGLEAYVQKEIVNDEETAALFISNKIRYNILYGDLLCLKLAYFYAEDSALEKIRNLSLIAEASKTASEAKKASKKMASRFIKTLSGLDIKYKNDIFENYRNETELPFHYAAAYGVFCSSAGIEYENAILSYLYSQVSAMVTNCVKLIPLSQAAGQSILNSSFDMLSECINKLDKLDESMLFMSTPAFDIRQMQHERLYSRLYMS